MSLRLFPCLSFLLVALLSVKTNANGSLVILYDGVRVTTQPPLEDVVPADIRYLRFKYALGAEDIFATIPDSEFAVIAKFPNIEALSVDARTEPLTAQTIRTIANCTNLKALWLVDAVICYDAIPILLKIPVYALELKGIPLSERLQFLDTQKLRSLTLTHCGLHNEDASLIANTPQLRYLDVSDNEYLDGDFVFRLGTRERLEDLYLDNVELSVAECRLIPSKFPRLQYMTGKTTEKGEELLESALDDFELTPYDGRRNPLSGLEEIWEAKEE